MQCGKRTLEHICKHKFNLHGNITIILKRDSSLEIPICESMEVEKVAFTMTMFFPLRLAKVVVAKYCRIHFDHS